MLLRNDKEITKLFGSKFQGVFFMKNLFSLNDLSNEEIMSLIHDAIAFRDKKLKFSLEGKIIANCFFENSTRTQYSFNTALLKLDAKVITFNPLSSSINKGETFYDTIKTFESFGIDGIIIRHSKTKYYEELKGINTVIINAGDGTGDHPSQNLLDLLTIYDEFGHFEGLKVMIAGDISHSRVAHGNVKIMERLGMKCFISGPKEFMDDTATYIDFDEGVKTCDVVMMLRIQRERNAHLESLTDEEYLNRYGLNMEKVKMMKSSAIIMHPAPFNRNVELADDVVECDKSRIFKQIENGVYAREAILKRSFE